MNNTSNAKYRIGATVSRLTWPGSNRRAFGTVLRVTREGDPFVRVDRYDPPLEGGDMPACRGRVWFVLGDFLFDMRRESN